MTTYKVTNVSTNQVFFTRQSNWADAMQRVCDLFGWTAHDIRVTKEGGLNHA